MILTLVFLICVAGIITPYIIYPAWLFICSRFRPVDQTHGDLLSVTFVISAFNEANVIQEKIENTLALDYPRHLLQVVVISDESDDGTDEIVAQFKEVDLIRQSPRRGKSAGINSSFDRFNGEVIVFSDANAIYQADAIKHLVRNFGNDRVGYVVGRQMYHDGESSAQESENVYWDYELKLKAWESRLSSVVGGDGAIMAIRKSLFSPLRYDDINDFVLPLRIVASGYRGKFEPRAICYEEAATSFRGEFRRKIRIVNRSLRALSRVPRALNPFVVGIFAAQLFCHKVIRWFAAFFMIGALVSNAFLAADGSRFFSVVLALQFIFYLTSLLARWTPVGRFKPAMLIYYFCMANLAGGLGVLNFLIGRKFATWTPQRDPGASELSGGQDAGV